MKTLAISDVTISVLTSPCTESAYGQLGDCMSKKQIDNLLGRARSNKWEWCDVEVRAEWHSLAASDYLGCCSYKNQKEFCQPGGYYDDMVQAVLDDLNS
jgi:hypothetical protein